MEDTAAAAFPVFRVYRIFLFAIPTVKMHDTTSSAYSIRTVGFESYLYRLVSILFIFTVGEVFPFIFLFIWWRLFFIFHLLFSSWWCTICLGELLRSYTWDSSRRYHAAIGRRYKAAGKGAFGSSLFCRLFFCWYIGYYFSIGEFSLFFLIDIVLQSYFFWYIKNPFPFLFLIC